LKGRWFEIFGIWKMFDGNPDFLAQIHRAWIFALVLGVLIVQFHEITLEPVTRAAHLVANTPLESTYRM